jgi:hypothetical protein
MLPVGLVFLSSDDGCSADAGTVTCSFGPSAVTQSQYLTFEVLVDPAAPDGILTNNATVAGNENDPNPANNGASAVISVDGTPPTVLSIRSGTDAVFDCDTIGAPPSDLVVDFSEALLNPPGDTGHDDVTNPDNYLLVGAGDDKQFDTAACGVVFGDDVAVTVDEVTVAEPPPPPPVPVTLTLAARPPESLLRLIVCGTTSVYDLAGNPLDGDGNGAGGDDFMRFFRLDTENLLVNPHLDCDLTGWTPSSGTPGEIEYITDDADDSAQSGSIQMRQLAANSKVFVTQCIDHSIQEPITFIGGRARVQTAPGVTLTLATSCEIFEQMGCGGASLGVHRTSLVVGDSGGSWTAFGGSVAAISNGSSARCRFGVVTSLGEDFTVWIDQLIVTAQLFADGFESGDTSAWSLATP